jgi:hypothetical protein
VEERDIKAPLVYVMGRDIEAEAAFYVFTHTPCSCAVVASGRDYDIAKQWVSGVFQAADESACRELASHLARSTGLPVLTIGEGKGMKAVHSSGDEEEICLSNLTFTN